MNRSAVLPALGLFLLIGAAYAPTRRRGLFGLGEEGDEDEGIRVTDIPDAGESMFEKIRRRQGLPPIDPEALPAEAESAEVIEIQRPEKKSKARLAVEKEIVRRIEVGLPLTKAQQKIFEEERAASASGAPSIVAPVVVQPIPAAPAPKASKRKMAGSKPAVPAPVPVPPREQAPSAAREAAMEREAPKTPKVVEPPVAPRRVLPPKVTKNDLIEVQKRRHAARKLYGTFVLSTQGADSMMRVSRKTNVEESRLIAESLYGVARAALKKARELDLNYIESQCSRPEGVPCPL
jgi:hypothetical protein